MGRSKEQTVVQSDLTDAQVRSSVSAMGLIRRHPMATFVVLAYAISWTTVPFFGFPLGVGPTLSALVVLSLTDGRSGIADLFRRIIQWRAHWTWYAVAIGLPAVAAAAAAVITVALGATMPTSAQLAEWTAVVPTFALLVVIPALGPWEEPGFRGFALSGFMRDRSPLVAGLAVGVIHVVWHVPLFFSGDIPAADVVYIMAAAVVFAWIVVGSGGSVLLAMLMHASSNAVSGDFISPMFSGADGSTLGWIRAGIWCLFALTVAIAADPSFRSRRPA